MLYYKLGGIFLYYSMRKIYNIGSFRCQCFLFTMVQIWRKTAQIFFFEEWSLTLFPNSMSCVSSLACRELAKRLVNSWWLFRLIYVGTIKNTREQNKNKEVTSKIVSAGRRINSWVVFLCVCDNDIYNVIYMYMHMWNHWNSSFIINDKLQSYLKYYSSYFSALPLVQGEEEANNSAWRFD